MSCEDIKIIESNTLLINSKFEERIKKIEYFISQIDKNKIDICTEKEMDNLFIVINHINYSLSKDIDIDYFIENYVNNNIPIEHTLLDKLKLKIKELLNIQ